MALVNQLSPVLGDLPFGEVPAPRPAAASDPIGGLVQVGLVARLLEAVGGSEAGKPGADDDDPRPTGRKRPRDRPAQHRGSGKAGATGQQLASTQTGRSLVNVSRQRLPRNLSGSVGSGFPQSPR